MAHDKNDKTQISAAVATWLKSQGKTPVVEIPAGKEREEVGKGVVEAAESQPPEEMIEIPTEPEIGKEVEGYMEKVEKAGELVTPVTDDYKQVLLQSVQDQKVNVKIPLTDEEIAQGLHHKVWEGIRWLAEWCVRQAKLIHGKIIK